MFDISTIETKYIHAHAMHATDLFTVARISFDADFTDIENKVMPNSYFAFTFVCGARRESRNAR